MTALAVAMSVCFNFLWHEFTSASAIDVIVGKQLRDEAEVRVGCSVEGPGEAHLNADHIGLTKVSRFNYSQT